MGSNPTPGVYDHEHLSTSRKLTADLIQYHRHCLYVTQPDAGFRFEFIRVGDKGHVRVLYTTLQSQAADESEHIQLASVARDRPDLGLPTIIGDNALSQTQAKGRAGPAAFDISMNLDGRLYSCVPAAFRIFSSNPRVFSNSNAAISGTVARDGENLRLENAQGRLSYFRGDDLASASWRLISAQSFPENQFAFEFMLYQALTRWRATGYIRHRNQWFDLTGAWTSLNSVEVRATGEMKVRLRYYYLTITLPQKKFHIDAWGDNIDYATLRSSEHGRTIATLRGSCQLSALRKDKSKGLWFFEEVANTYRNVLLENKYSEREIAKGPTPI